MRRILRKVARGDFENLGDTSTLADPGVVESLITNKVKLINKYINTKDSDTESHISIIIMKDSSSYSLISFFD